MTEKRLNTRERQNFQDIGWKFRQNYDSYSNSYYIKSPSGTYKASPDAIRNIINFQIIDLEECAICIFTKGVLVNVSKKH